MKTIWKYQLALVDGRQARSAPWPFRVIHFAMQRGSPCIWAHVESDHPQQVSRDFYVLGTGHEVPDEAQYYHGTAMHHALQADYVWHLYEHTDASTMYEA
jgi:hypothetical protein